MKDVTTDPSTASARLAAIVESSGDAIFSKDLDGNITSWNTGAQMLFGYTANEAIGQPVTMLMLPEQLEEESGKLERIRRGQKVEHYETVRRRKDGSLIDISLAVSPIYNADGVVVGASKIARDITGRKQNEAELARLAAVIETSTDAIITKDLNGVITSWNLGAELVFGYTADEVIGKPVTILMPPERVNEEPGILERIRRGDKVDHYETIRRRKDGTLLNISLNVSPIYDVHGVIVGASKIARDITATKRIESAKREVETAHSLLNAQESERARIARDLHDHLGQQMTALRLKLESIKEKCGANEDLRREILELRKAALKIDRDIGFLSWELRPIELDDLGLKEALASFVNEWSKQSSVDANFLSNVDAIGNGLPSGVEINLYRILQECLNNILKHADAKAVSVLLHQRPNELVLVVEDDGIGISGEESPGNQKVSRGLGLTGIQERASLLGGSVEIESESGKGTTVIVRVPRQKH